MQFFMQGTLLQSLSDSYANIEQSVAQLERHRTQTREMIPDLGEAWDRLSRKEKETNRLLEMRCEADKIEGELAWAYVVDKEKVRTRHASMTDVRNGTTSKPRWMIRSKRSNMSQSRSKRPR